MTHRMCVYNFFTLMQSRKNLATHSSLDEEVVSRGSLDSAAEPPADGQWSKRWTKGPSPSGNAMIAQESYGASWPLQFTTLLRRALKVRRFEALSIQDMAQAVALAVLGGTQPILLFSCTSACLFCFFNAQS